MTQKVESAGETTNYTYHTSGADDGLLATEESPVGQTQLVRSYANHTPLGMARDVTAWSGAVTTKQYDYGGMRRSTEVGIVREHVDADTSRSNVSSATMAPNSRST